MIGPIRGNSWRLLISLSLRLRECFGSVPRQLSKSTDMDLFFEGTSRSSHIDEFGSVLTCGVSRSRRFRPSLLHGISSVREKRRLSVVCKLCARLLILLGIKVEERRNKEKVRSKGMKMEESRIDLAKLCNHMTRMFFSFQ